MRRQVATHSQHFLRNPRLIAELIGHSNIRRGDLVIDIGAGSGAITAVLARRCRQVLAYENEPGILNKLQQNMRRHKNVKVIAQDFLQAKLPDEPYKVFANIPFHLSADIIRKLTNNDETHTPQAIYLIVQKQFAQKLVPSDRHFTSQLGAQLAPWWQTRIRRPLRRTDFTPPPAVDTVLLELKPRPEPLLPTLERDEYQSFVAKCYASQKVFAAVPCAKASINPERKPSELTPEEWVRLYSMS